MTETADFDWCTSLFLHTAEWCVQKKEKRAKIVWYKKQIGFNSGGLACNS